MTPWGYHFGIAYLGGVFGTWTPNLGLKSEKTLFLGSVDSGTVSHWLTDQCVARALPRPSMDEILQELL